MSSPACCAASARRCGRSTRSSSRSPAPIPTATQAVITMTSDAQQLQLLLAWMSPAFPIGGFAYSHGLEFAIEDKQVTDAATLRQWIEDVLTRGSGWNDAVIVARCWDEDADALNGLALALAGSRERYLETTSLGNAFMQAAAMWNLQEEPPRPLGEG